MEFQNVNVIIICKYDLGRIFLVLDRYVLLPGPNIDKNSVLFCHLPTLMKVIQWFILIQKTGLNRDNEDFGALFSKESVFWGQYEAPP